MNIEVLFDYVNVLILLACLCVGYVIKNLIPSKAVNRYIPLIAGVLGVLLSWWSNGSMTLEILVIGLISGLASTGLYETFRNLINRGGKNA